MQNLNNCTIKIYEARGSTTLVPDPLGELEHAQDLKFNNYFPGGLYGACSFKLRRDVTLPFVWTGGMRLVVENGLPTAYEGLISQVTPYVDATEQGLIFTAYGQWGQILEKWTINKVWADNRLSSWRWGTSATETAKELIGFDKNGRLRFTPSDNDFLTDHLASLYYNMPNTQTIKRVALSYDFSERYTTQPAAAKVATLTGYDTPKSVKHGVYYGYATATKVFSVISSVFADRANTYDGSVLTSDTFTLAAASDLIWVRFKEPFNSIKVNLGATVNNNAATLSVAIYVGGVITNVSGLSDGTASGGAMFAQDGVISWTAPATWDEATVNGYRGYWARLKPSAALDAVQFIELEPAEEEAFNFTTLTNAFDGSAGTSVNASFVLLDRLYVCYELPTNGTKFDFGATVNAVVATMSAKYWRGEIATDDGLQASQWASITISDGTLSGGATLAMDGAMTYSDPVNWAETTVDGVRGYWIYFEPSATLTANVTFNEIYCENPDVYSFADLPGCIDGDTSTNESVTLARDQYLYIRAGLPNWGFVAFNFGFLVNNNAATMAVQYYQAEQVASTGIVPAAWATLAITDGTASGGATWAMSGDMVFTTTPTDWQEIAIDGERGFWLRMQPSSDLDIATVNEIYAGITQAWQLRVRDRDGATDIWSLTATASGTRDDTLGTPRQRLDLEMISKAAQLGESNGTVYGQITVPIVYGMTGSLNLATIATDIIATVTDINSGTEYVSTPGSPLSLVPFFTEGSETAGSILARAMSLGDTSFNAWYCQLLASRLAKTYNGKPVLKVAQFPDVTTGYDYQLYITDPALNGLQTPIDYDNIVNYVKVAYTDSEGIKQEVTPDDDAALTDATSVTKYGRREFSAPPDMGTATSAEALNFGKRLLATRKNPRVIVSQPIAIIDHIFDRYGQPVPACQIISGMRVRFMNYINDVIGTNGAGFTAIISNVDYDDNTKTATLSFGVYDDLAVLLAQRSFFNDRDLAF